MTSFRAELAPRIAPVVLANLTCRFPFHDAHLYVDGDNAFDPARAHPAFGNSYDWHSSVHSHWTALELIAFAGGEGSENGVDGLRAVVAAHLSAANIDVESSYLAAHPTYERPYGWAWSLKLATSAPPAMRAMAAQIAERSIAWLRTLPGPVRHGVHSNTAFAMGLMHEAAQRLQLTGLESTIADCARAWFLSDRDYPTRWERSAHDFLSPGLSEADLMRRVLAKLEFAGWWRAFVPSLAADDALFAVARVPDDDDGQLVHLHGLNLSRAAMLARIADALNDRSSAALREHATRLYRAGVGHAHGKNYLASHWLPTFAWDSAAALDA